VGCEEEEEREEEELERGRRPGPLRDDEERGKRLIFSLSGATGAAVDVAEALYLPNNEDPLSSSVRVRPANMLLTYVGLVLIDAGFNISCVSPSGFSLPPLFLRASACGD
jgi:hypothetical protein